MNNDEIRKIIREEIRKALRDIFSEMRLSQMEEDLGRGRTPPSGPRRFDHQVDRLAFYTDRLMMLSMQLEDWGSECECKYSASDIKYIKDKVDSL